ncbi:MAG TPA: GH3 auxin-responsive promoter family protein [Verrucomicrobiae bacterium]
MKPVATITNLLWGAANVASYRRFSQALQEPERVQQERLRTYLRANATSAFGRKYDFASIHDYETFAQRVPLMDYEDLEPWIVRICKGEADVLTCERVTRLVPTSGSTGARKLIPFTAGLQGEFNAAVGPWLVDLLRQSSGIAGGPAYWSITPVAGFEQETDSVVPVGFDTDTAYLGGTRQRLANAVMAVPTALGKVSDIECFRYLTLLCLLRERDLRLISVWHPSFLTLLLEKKVTEWDDLLADIRKGTCKHGGRVPGEVIEALNLRPLPRRAAELAEMDARKPELIWPELKLISCWEDGAAGLAAAKLRSIFSQTWIQAKGLLATEACVTIPFGGQNPVAVESHFFEFMDDGGKILRVHELQEGQTYEVIVTTAGGLWRYRLRDSVRVEGFVGRTPSLRFLGRSGNVSDLCGEKLAEAFVVQVLQKTLAGLEKRPDFVFLAPDTDDESNPHYTLYAEGNLPERFDAVIEQALRENPHYAYCRDLGQLKPLRVFQINERAEEKFFQRAVAKGARLGELKPMGFSKVTGWSEFFEGRYG